MISAQLFLEKEQLKCVVAFTAYRSRPKCCEAKVKYFHKFSPISNEPVVLHTTVTLGAGGGGQWFKLTIVPLKHPATGLFQFRFGTNLLAGL